MARPGPNPNRKVPGYYARRATVEDVPEICALGNERSFNIGSRNFELFIRSNPECWHVIVKESTGEIVSYDSYNKLNLEDIYMGFQLIVKKTYESTMYIIFFIL